MPCKNKPPVGTTKRAVILSTSLGDSGRGFLGSLSFSVEGMENDCVVLPPLLLCNGDSCYDFVMSICEAVGVKMWEDLKGKRCRVALSDDGGWGCKFLGVGNRKFNVWVNMEDMQSDHEKDKPSKHAKRRWKDGYDPYHGKC